MRRAGAESGSKSQAKSASEGPLHFKRAPRGDFGPGEVAARANGGHVIFGQHAGQEAVAPTKAVLLIHHCLLALLVMNDMRPRDALEADVIVRVEVGDDRKARCSMGVIRHSASRCFKMFRLLGVLVSAGWIVWLHDTAAKLFVNMNAAHFAPVPGAHIEHRPYTIVYCVARLPAVLQA